MPTTLSPLAICCMLLAPALAHAQASHFKGFGTALNLHAATTTVEATLQSNASTYAGSDRDANLSLQAHYNWALNDRYTLGVGTSSAWGKRKAGTLNFTAAGTPIAIKESYSLFLAPGYAISKDWLVYGKLAYEIAKAEAQGGNSTGFDGLGLGLGLQVMLTTNWYMQAELLGSRFTDHSDALETDRLKSNSLSLGVGYKF